MKMRKKRVKRTRREGMLTSERKEKRRKKSRNKRRIRRKIRETNERRS